MLICSTRNHTAIDVPHTKSCIKHNVNLSSRLTIEICRGGKNISEPTSVVWDLRSNMGFNIIFKFRLEFSSIRQNLLIKGELLRLYKDWIGNISN